MWLYVPSQSAQESEGSISELILLSPETFARSSMWRGKRSPPAAWSKRWRKVSWLRLLSGATLPPSAAQSAAITFAQSGRSTSSSAESRVSPGRSQERGLAPLMRETYGGRLVRLSKPIRLGSYLSKMSQGSLFQMDSEESCETFTNWVTKLRADSLARRKSARRMAVSGSSSWPTCDANTSTRSNGHMGPNLRELAANWPTVRTSSANGSSESERNNGNPKVRLEVEAEMCAVHFSRQGRATETDGDTSSKTGPNSPPQFPTPRTGKPDKLESHHDSATPVNHRLNPIFVEWLMGFPIGLTASAPAETQSSPSPPRSLSSASIQTWRARMTERLSEIIDDKRK